MVRRKEAAPQGEGLPVESLGFSVLAQGHQGGSQVVGTLRHVGMLAQAPAPDLQRLAEQRLGLVELPLGKEQSTVVVEHHGDLVVVLAQETTVAGESLAIEGIACLVASQTLEDGGQVVEGVGDPEVVLTEQLPADLQGFPVTALRRFVLAAGIEQQAGLVEGFGHFEMRRSTPAAADSERARDLAGQVRSRRRHGLVRLAPASDGKIERRKIASLSATLLRVKE